MNMHKAQFREHQIRFLELQDNDLLLNTKDVLAVLGINDRPQGSDLSEPHLDLTSAVGVSNGKDDDFSIWLNETFSGYNLETLVRPSCDDEWNFKYE